MFPDWVKLRRMAAGLVSRKPLRLLQITILLTSAQTTVSGGLGCAALVDLLVALTLTFYLKRGRQWETGTVYQSVRTFRRALP